MRAVTDLTAAKQRRLREHPALVTIDEICPDRSDRG